MNFHTLPMPMLRLSSLSTLGTIFSKPFVRKSTETYVAEVDNPLNSGPTGTGIEQMGHIKKSQDEKNVAVTWSPQGSSSTHQFYLPSKDDCNSWAEEDARNGGS